MRPTFLLKIEKSISENNLLITHINLLITDIIFLKKIEMKEVKKTIEQKVADVILERDIATIEINGKTYNVAQPTIATLIMVSEIVSTLPVVENVEADKILYTVLHNAKDFRRLGDLMAVMILGAKGVTEGVTKKRFFGLIKTTKITNKKAELSKEIMENVTPKELFKMVLERLRGMEIMDFFALTTSLSEANILKATKEVD